MKRVPRFAPVRRNQPTTSPIHSSKDPPGHLGRRPACAWSILDERLINATTPYGPSASQHDRVFSFVSHEQRVLARDPATGEIVWQTQLDNQLVGHVSTVQGAVVARKNQATVVQLDPATGKVRGTMTTESARLPVARVKHTGIGQVTTTASRRDLDSYDVPVPHHSG